MNIRKVLFENKDLKYKEFQKKLIPNIDETKIIGVRIPILHKIAKALDGDDFSWEYFEEVMLHGFHIGYGNYSFEQRISLLDDFVLHIDNWAVCDSVASTLKFINNNKPDFFKYIKKYLNSSDEYQVRFAIVVLMNYYFDDDYIDFCLDYLKKIRSEYYYVNMASAWALSAAFIMYRDKTLEIIKSGCLTSEIQNMTISKIRDSFRVEKEMKEYLKSFKRQH